MHDLLDLVGDVDHFLALPGFEDKIFGVALQSNASVIVRCPENTITMIFGFVFSESAPLCGQQVSKSALDCFRRKRRSSVTGGGWGTCFLFI
jgi:hypothetical protein